ncbi:MAG: choice-of-anchor E domain-containing protein, partial [Tepidisphaeraceae bacterium]
MKKRVLSAIMLSVFMGSAALANTTVLFGPFVTTTPISSALTDWNMTLSLPKFNPAWGTLKAIEIDLSGGITTTITVTNDAKSPSKGSFQTECQILVQDPGNNFGDPQIDLASSFNYLLRSGGSISSGALRTTGSSSDTYTLDAILAEFTGTGTILLNASTQSDTLLANRGGNTIASQVT